MAERAVATAKASESKQKCSNSCKQTSFNSSVSPAGRILQLQRTAGNQAVQRLVKSGVLQAKPKSQSYWRVSIQKPPGWINVSPTYSIIKNGEPFEFPHFLKVEENSVSEDKKNKNVTALEGRYKGKDADIGTDALAPVAPADSAATAKFDLTKGKFWYGGKEPVVAITDSSNPIPIGKHDIEIPDFQHGSGAKYGNFGTTWFRLGHSGDRYLHPGRISLGCITITDISKWPQIWKYLISARKDDQSVGELEVVK